MAERNSGHTRDPFDWYVEDIWCTHALLNMVSIVGDIHDPCCGQGNIVTAIRERGRPATGADIIQRAAGFEVINFLDDFRPRANVVTNPPFRISEKIIEHALFVTHSGGIVAVLAQAKFLYSQGRSELFDSCEQILHCSTRPNMPKGTALIEHGEAIRGGGSIDFSWCIWRSGAPAYVETKTDWVLWQGDRSVKSGRRQRSSRVD